MSVKNGAISALDAELPRSFAHHSMSSARACWVTFSRCRSASSRLIAVGIALGEKLRALAAAEDDEPERLAGAEGA